MFFQGISRHLEIWVEYVRVGRPWASEELRAMTRQTTAVAPSKFADLAH